MFKYRAICATLVMAVSSAALAQSPPPEPPQAPIILQMSRAEAQALRKALDSAIRGGGMDVAYALLPIDSKLIAAARVAQDADLTAQAREKVRTADEAAKPKPDKPPLIPPEALPAPAPEASPAPTASPTRRNDERDDPHAK